MCCRKYLGLRFQHSVMLLTIKVGKDESWSVIRWINISSFDQTDFSLHMLFAIILANVYEFNICKSGHNQPQWNKQCHTNIRLGRIYWHLVKLQRTWYVEYFFAFVAREFRFSVLACGAGSGNGNVRRCLKCHLYFCHCPLKA